MIDTEEYGEVEWGYTKSYVSRLTNAAKTEKVLELPIGNSEIPESHLRPLNNVPDDVKREIWEQVNAENEKVTAKKVEDAVKEWKRKNESLQLELKQETELKQAVQGQRDQFLKERDEYMLRSQNKVNEAIEKERKHLNGIIETAKQEAEKLKSDIEALNKKHKSELDKKVKDSVSIELNKHAAKLKQQEKILSDTNKTIEELYAKKAELQKQIIDDDLGQKYTEQIKSSLVDLSGVFSLLKELDLSDYREHHDILNALKTVCSDYEQWLNISESINT